MTESTPDVLDFAEALRSLARGWRWIGVTFVIAAAATATALTVMPERFQSTLELRLAAAREPLLADIGLQLGAGDVIPLFLGAETRRAAAALQTSPAVADEAGWTADQVTAVGNGQGTVFVLVRDEDPELAAATANAVEAAARQVRGARLEQGLREALGPLERERQGLLAGLEELEASAGRGRPGEGPLDETLDRLRLTSALERIVALEGQMARIRVLMADPPADWRVVERASPGRHALRDRSTAKALVAVLAPTLLAAIIWLIHDGRPRRG